MHDLGDLYLKLAEAAADALVQPEKKDERPLWDSQGYFFAENGEQTWGETSAQLAKQAVKMKLLESEEVDDLAPENAKAFSAHGPLLWGQNSRSRASRARKYLGWSPTGKIEGCFEEVLEAEARALGVTKGHAVVAAGDA